MSQDITKIVFAPPDYVEPKPAIGGGPAFPCHTNPLPGKLASAPQGMTLRDYFAGQALAGELANTYDGIWENSAADSFLLDRAKLLYRFADAMLKAREAQ